MSSKEELEAKLADIQIRDLERQAERYSFRGLLFIGKAILIAVVMVSAIPWIGLELACLFIFIAMFPFFAGYYNIQKAGETRKRSKSARETYLRSPAEGVGEG